MSAHSPEPTKPPRLIFSLVILAAAIASALVFASAFKHGAGSVSDPIVCAETAELDEERDHAHGTQADKKAPLYFIGGLWSPEHGLAPMLDAAMLAAADERPIVCQSAIAEGEALTIINRSPIRFGSKGGDPKPDLVLSIDYTGSISSMEYPGAGALQKYITDQKANYNAILIIEPLPGPVRDPDEDWTYLNFDGDNKISFFTPKRKSTPQQVALKLFEELGGEASKADDLEPLLEQLESSDRVKADSARLQLIERSPYETVPALERWVDAAEQGEARERRVYESLMVRRGMGVHADALITEAATSENIQLRTLAARTLGDLAGVSTDPLGRLTPLAEDDALPVRYEALVATRAVPGRRAAGVAELVEPYKMTDAMRTVYRNTMDALLVYGEPIAADSKANRLRRMAINELLGEERNALVCAILLERTDLPDGKIDEVLGQLAEANGRGPLVALLNLLEAMNPRTLAKREVLLEKLVAWKTNELNAQTPRLKEMALGQGFTNLRRAAAAAMIMSSETADVFRELGPSPIPYEGLAWIKDAGTLNRWAEPIALRIATQKDVPLETTVAAMDAVRLLPEAAVSDAMIEGLLKVARGQEAIALRFAAIRAINALPESKQPENTGDLKLSTLTISAVKGTLAYDKTTLTAAAGQPVELTMLNPDTMEHNLVITKPGMGQTVGVAGAAVSAADQHVPDSDDVLHYTPLIKPGAAYTLRFFAPDQPGQYDYVCTFPGHPAAMKGILNVTAP